MTTKELNDYILNYLKNDKTQSAIMLTAPWGTGKSYYIQNILKPFLEQKWDEYTDAIQNALLDNSKKKRQKRNKSAQKRDKASKEDKLCYYSFFIWFNRF